jgi:hypothetical protein
MNIGHGFSALNVIFIPAHTTVKDPLSLLKTVVAMIWKIETKLFWNRRSLRDHRTEKLAGGGN